jgi:hypothetical protein
MNAARSMKQSSPLPFGDDSFEIELARAQFIVAPSTASAARRPAKRGQKRQKAAAVLPLDCRHLLGWSRSIGHRLTRKNARFRVASFKRASLGG